MEHLDCNGLRSRTYLGLKQIKVRKETEVEKEEEAVSPIARMFHEPESNIYVILIMGFKIPIDPHTLKANLLHLVVKHPRFSSIVQVADGGEMKWVKTRVDIDNHVKVPLVDQDQDMVSSDKFVEDYVANLSRTQISMSIHMWDCHILNLKTSDAESTLVLLLTWNTLVEICMCVATTYFLKDTETPLKAPSRSVASTCRRIVRRTFCFDDVKSVKNATNTTVNDVMLAITQAGLSRYLNRKYATLFINMRSSPGIYALEEMVKKNSKAEWGNKIGYVVFPLKIALKDNPLDYIKGAKARMDRKKATLEAKFRLFMVFVKFYPTKLASFPLTTLWFSNVAGPQDQISICGNQVAFIATFVYGQPVALTIHINSYLKNITVVLLVVDNIIPDPYELCDDIEEALKLIKITTIDVNCEGSYE
ncbi:NTHASE/DIACYLGLYCEROL ACYLTRANSFERASE 11, FOLDED PETAL 1 [Hibiscus trionum]|uniref:NTHASE/DIACYLGLYCEROL ACYLTRANSFERASE 11, FOLDED PETAL 1 n=1 Tax=Hibiscus trionum TaxID=183268 RepID=A0A9W7JHI0_HIBTR|nr:NTHASE/DIACYLGLYCEROL ACYLTRANSFERASE 11, FOLDED PETAL 1 [Hibiscus trionum]